MKKCKKCNDQIPKRVTIGGIVRNLQKRKYCLLCSPFGSHNTKKLEVVVTKKECGNCGKNVRFNFCDNFCQMEHQYRAYIKRWLAGEEKGYGGRCWTTSAHIRKWLKETRGEKCETCGWNERNEKRDRVPVQIDHIDGNARNCRPDNLRLLCPNHHSLTQTFGGLNKGKGRKFRYASKA